MSKDPQDVSVAWMPFDIEVYTKRSYARHIDHLSVSTARNDIVAAAVFKGTDDIYTKATLGDGKGDAIQILGSSDIKLGEDDKTIVHSQKVNEAVSGAINRAFDDGIMTGDESRELAKIVTVLRDNLLHHRDGKLTTSEEDAIVNLANNVGPSPIGKGHAH